MSRFGNHLDLEHVLAETNWAIMDAYSFSSTLKEMKRLWYVLWWSNHLQWFGQKSEGFLTEQKLTATPSEKLTQYNMRLKEVQKGPL